MIDIEAAVFDAVYQVVTTRIPPNSFKSEYVRNPASLPFATLIEVDNMTDERSRGTALDEEYSLIAYESNVYAMSKAECRAIAGLIDETLKRMNFACSSLRFTPNLSDPDIYRITGRYQAAVNANGDLYRR